MYDIKLPITENISETTSEPEDCLNEVMTLFAQDDDNDIV